MIPLNLSVALAPYVAVSVSVLLKELAFFACVQFPPGEYPIEVHRSSNWISFKGTIFFCRSRSILLRLARF